MTIANGALDVAPCRIRDPREEGSLAGLWEVAMGCRRPSPPFEPAHHLHRLDRS